MPRQRSGSTQPHSERRVRKEARRIFDQLERGLDPWYTVAGLVILAALVGIGPYCRIALEMAWWKVVAWGVGGTFAVMVVAVIVVTLVEENKVDRALRRFNLRFPKDSERREWAVSLLADFRPTNDGSTKFLNTVVPASMRANVTSSEDGFVSVEDLEQELEEATARTRDAAPRRREGGTRHSPPVREAIPVDTSRDPDALIPLELPPDVQRKERSR